MPTLLIPEFDIFERSKSIILYFPPIGTLAVVLEDASSGILSSSVAAKMKPSTLLLLIAVHLRVAVYHGFCFDNCVFFDNGICTDNSNSPVVNIFRFFGVLSDFCILAYNGVFGNDSKLNLGTVLNYRTGMMIEELIVAFLPIVTPAKRIENSRLP